MAMMFCRCKCLRASYRSTRWIRSGSGGSPGGKRLQAQLAEMAPRAVGTVPKVAVNPPVGAVTDLAGEDAQAAVAVVGWVAFRVTRWG